MITVKRTMGTLAAVALALPLGAGVASAGEAGAPPDSPKAKAEAPAGDLGQTGSFLTETLKEAMFQFQDALNGDNRPDGGNGTEAEFPPLDPRYLGGPIGGLLNGPFS